MLLFNTVYACDGYNCYDYSILWYINIIFLIILIIWLITVSLLGYHKHKSEKWLLKTIFESNKFFIELLLLAWVAVIIYVWAIN